MIRDERKTAVDKLIPLIDAWWILELGISRFEVSWLTLEDLITGGELKVCDITGQTIDSYDIPENMRGLWVFESELDRFIDLVNGFH